MSLSDTLQEEAEAERRWQAARNKERRGMSEDTTEKKAVRYASKGSDFRNPGYQNIELTNLTTDDLTALEAALNGTAWVRVSEGRVERGDAYERPPSPAEDPVVGPHWPANGREAVCQREPFGLAREMWSPSLFMQHLCGYNYSEGGYAMQAATLEEWGWQCLRSRRGEDGQIWEVWFLPGLWAAKGTFGEFLQPYKSGTLNDEQIKRIIDWLCRHASFGTLDIAVQRAAMVID